MAKATNSSIPPILWTANDHELTWKLLAEMEKEENYKVLFGKVNKNENTSGDTKITVCKRIGQALLPTLFPEHAGTIGDRVRGKINDLHKQYIKQAKKLRQTGGGLNPESETQAEAGGNQYLDFYIAPDGPDHDTHPTARNLWAAPSTTAAVNPPPATIRSFGTSYNTNMPLMTPQRGPRASTLSQTMVENAKSKITKLPQKRSFEDRIIELQEKNIAASDHREAEERALKKQKMLLREYELKIWTRDEYQQRLAIIENSLKVYDNSVKENQPALPPSPLSTPIRPSTPILYQRVPSPAWDIEDDTRPLPTFDPSDEESFYTD